MTTADFYLLLQQYWWFLVSLLGAFLVFLMFVQGGQTIFNRVSTNEMEKTMAVNAMGRKWEITFTTLVTFGGAAFASFPLFYATSFGGAYWVWIAILFCFIIQAVSYEYRRKQGNTYGTKTYDTFLYINGSLGVILLGTAVGTFFTGSEFFVDDYNRSFWQLGSRGLEAALNINNVALGLAIFFLARVMGAMYFIHVIRNENVERLSRKQVGLNSIFFLVFFLYWFVQLMIRDGFAYDPETLVVSMEPLKYFNNLIEMPIVMVVFLLGVVLVLSGIFMSVFKKYRPAFWVSGTGVVMTVLSVFLIAGLNQTCFYPSTYDLQSSLTIVNASSSHFTLRVMTYVSFMIPFVLAYIVWAWNTMDKGKITEEDANSGELKY